MIKDYFRLAYLSTKKRKIRSWLTMVGIFIGIAAVVALISLSQGLKVAISEQFSNLGTDKIVITASGGGFGPPGTAIESPLTIDDEEKIKKVRGVDLVVGRLIKIVQLDFNKERKFTYAVSVPREKEERDLVIEVNDYQIGKGRFLDKESKYDVVIGYKTANDFFNNKVEIRDKIKIQNKNFKVIGILKKAGNPQRDDSVVLPEESLREILNLGNELDVIPLKVKGGEKEVPFVAERVKKTLRKHRNVEEGKEDFEVEVPQNLIATLTNILLVVQGVLVGIASISLIVGGIGIMNTMYTSVLERTREIGIMKSFGATQKNIFSLFLIESGLLGMLGGIIGVSLGFIISKSVEYFSFQYYQNQLIRAEFSPYLLIGALLFAFLVGTLSGSLPARQAAKLKPIEAMRK